MSAKLAARKEAVGSGLWILNLTRPIEKRHGTGRGRLVKVLGRKAIDLGGYCVQEQMRSLIRIVNAGSKRPRIEQRNFEMLPGILACVADQAMSNCPVNLDSARK